MANDKEIKHAIVILLNARLRNSPTRDELPGVVATWKRIAYEIPGNYLAQATNNIIRTSEFWPSIKQVLDAAKEARAAAEPGAGKPSGYIGEKPIELTVRHPFVVVTANGWRRWEPTPGFIPDHIKYAEIIPPAHPEFDSWVEAQEWQEAQRIGK